jgi:hypothetical protein
MPAGWALNGAEQDVILADEFGDGNVPAGSGYCRVVDKALAALPCGIAKISVATARFMRTS